MNSQSARQPTDRYTEFMKAEIQVSNKSFLI